MSRIAFNEVLSELRQAALCDQARGHEPAKRISRHDHFRRVYSRSPKHVEMNPQAGLAVSKAVEQQFGADKVRACEGAVTTRATASGDCEDARWLTRNM